MSPTMENPSVSRLRHGLEARIGAGDLELPMLPDSAAQVLALCNDVACDPRRLTDLIQRDPSLAGHVLRIANSAAYAPKEPIVSLQQAIGRLGQRTLCEIAIASATSAKVFKVPGREAEARALWRHSALAGAWAREIARARRRNVESAFLSGLLHDVGKPVLFQAVADLAAAAGADEETIQLCVHELHADVGAILLERWKMPAWMCAAVRFHHAPDRAAEHTDLAATVCFGHLIAHHMASGDANDATPLRTNPVLALLGLYADELDEVLARREQVEKTAQAFS